MQPLADGARTLFVATSWGIVHAALEQSNYLEGNQGRRGTRQLDPIVIMVLIVVANVILGTFMDALPAILIFVPIIHPLAVAVGIHPVHLGVIVVMTQSFGLLTPPLGMVAMTACAVAGVPMMKIQMLLHLMMIPLLVVIVLCALAPWTELLLPRLLVPNWL